MVVPPSVEKRQCDENNNSNNASSTATTVEKNAEKSSTLNTISSSGDIDDDDGDTAAVNVDNNECDEKSGEKIKPKQMVGLFPLDLRSELKKRVGGGKAGFALKKSVTNVDMINNNSSCSRSAAISIPMPRMIGKPNDLLKSMQAIKLAKNDSVDDDDEEPGVENLSFKEKLKLIERSSSRSLIVNPP